MEYICRKVSKKLYSLLVLKRAGVDEMSILKVYLTTIRPVLEYAIPVWRAIPDYLHDSYVGINNVPLQQQQNGSDCRVFAIAFATCFVYSESPDIPNMRKHMVQCLKNRKMELFPAVLF